MSDETTERCNKQLARDHVCGKPKGHDKRCGEPTPADRRMRANYIGAPHFFNLNQACALIGRAYGYPYLVGSALERRDFRDVDVRCILDDAEYDTLFGKKCSGGAYDARWSLLCASISLWLSQQSGLPIDFQFQRMTDANAKYGGERQGLGLFIDYPGERPSDIAAPPEGAQP